MDLALNNLQRLICHKTQTNQTKPNQNLIPSTNGYATPTIHHTYIVIIIIYRY